MRLISQMIFNFPTYRQSLFTFLSFHNGDYKILRNCYGNYRNDLLYIPTGLFLNNKNKKTFERNKSVSRKGCQLNTFKLWLMYPFVTLSLNKMSGSHKLQFLFNRLKCKNNEEFLKNGIFCTFELIEKSILRKRLSQDTLSNVYLNKYWSNFRFILLLSDYIYWNVRPIITARNGRLCKLLLRSYSFSTS